MQRAVRWVWGNALRWHAEIAIIAVAAALATATVVSTSPTADEQKHILNGFSYQATGRGLHEETPSARLHALFLDRESLRISPIEDYRDVDAARHEPVKDLWVENAHDARRISMLSRVFTVLAFLVLLIICARWAHALFSPTAARVVLAFTATSSTLLAHASVATSDMFLTTCAFGACHALFCYRREATVRRAVVLAIWVGLALLAKISGLFVYGTIVLAFAWGARRERPIAGRIVLILVVPLVILHAGYGLRGALRPMNSYELQSQGLRDVAGTAVGSIPLPVPAGFVQAIDFSLADRHRRHDVSKAPSYMLGEAYVGKRLTYFPFAFAVKTSGVLLLFLALGIVAARKRAPPETFLAVGLFPIVFLLTNIFWNPFDIGVRYVLPIYPFVILCGGFAMLDGFGKRIAVPAAVLQLAIAGLTFPNYIASFNFSSWIVPKHVLLSDSNLDWGQMNHLVVADLTAHPTRAPVALCTLGSVSGMTDRRYACQARAREARIYLSTTIQHFRTFDALAKVLPAPTRTLADVIDVYDVTMERDLDVAFVNVWEVSAPFPAPLDPTNMEWIQREQAPFVRHETRFGLLDIRAIHRGVELPHTCVLARSTHSLIGEVLLGADDTMYVYDQGAIIARDLSESNVHWPETRVVFSRPTQLRMLLCNLGRDFAVQAGVRPPSSSSVLAVHRHDARPAEAEVVLERDLRALDLTLLGRAAQVPHELGALREAGGAQRVTLGEQTTRRVRDELAAVGVVAVPDELLRLAFLAQAERLVREELVRGEAVVELDDLDLVGADAGLLVDLLRAGLRHVVADHLDHRVLLEGRRIVGRHRLRCDVHGLGDVVLLREVVGAQHGRGGAACRRAALEARQRIEHLGRGHDLLDGEHLLEQRVRVLRRVLARLRADLREGLLLGAVLQRYSRPAPPNICAAGGAELKPCSSFITLTNLSSGFARSVHLAWSAPASICSKPTTITHSAMPPATACAPSISAELPVEQLLLTLKTGMPVWPSW